MSQMQLPKLTVEFLEDAVDGLRLITQSNWSAECLLSSRPGMEAGLASSASRKWLDVPGVYLLFGLDARKSDGNRSPGDKVYVGQADSVADRLDSHLRNENKRWWRTVLVVRRPEKRPLNITDCRFLESRLYALALGAGKCDLDNRVAPQPPFLTPADQRSLEIFLDQTLVITSALGFDFFRAPNATAQPSQSAAESPGPPSPPATILPLLEEIRKAVTGPVFPKSEWYSTHTPDFRAKVVSNGDLFRVFARVTWTKDWFWISLKDVGKYKVSRTGEVDTLSGSIQTAYRKAEQHLQPVR